MKKLLSGNEAIARGAFEAGAEAAFAYPGTPSTEIIEYIALKFPEIYSEWAPNEKVSLESAIGSSLYGARTLVAMKHVGLNVAADPLFSLSYMGLNGGVVIVNADEPSMFSSQNEQDNRWYGISAKIPVLEPSDSQEAKELVKEGFKLSEKYDTPVILRITTRIAHSKSIVTLENRETPASGFSYKKDFRKNVLTPMNARIKHRIVEERMENLKAVSEDFSFNRHIPGKGRAIITSGIDFHYVREVFPDADILKISLSNPLPKQLISDFIDRHQGRVSVIESLDPVMESRIKSWGYSLINGKDKTGLLYELSPEKLQRVFSEQQETTENSETDTTLPSRPPVLCAGCPHRGIYHSLRKQKAIVHGDIGCYTLGALPPLEAMDTCVCMGASISMASGMTAMLVRNGETAPPIFATIGDSTFIHSGIQPLIDAVYNQIPTHVIILDNRITAMTGHQVNPVTGLNIKGEEAPILDLEKLCLAIGIKEVDTVNPWNLKEITEALNKHKELNEPSVIISKGPCALIPFYQASAPYQVDTDKCTLCKACIRTGCPAISVENDKSHIDINSCTGCGVCFQVCKFDAIQQIKENE